MLTKPEVPQWVIILGGISTIAATSLMLLRSALRESGGAISVALNAEKDLDTTPLKRIADILDGNGPV